MELQNTPKTLTELYTSDQEMLVSLTGNSLNSHTATLNLTCKNKEEFDEWLKRHEKITGVTFRIKNTRPRAGQRVIFKGEFRCHRNTYPTSHSANKTASKKHTGCQAALKVTIKTQNRQNRPRIIDRSQEYFNNDFPTLVIANHEHNHKIDTDEDRRYKDTSEEVKNKFLYLFQNNVGPSHALHIHRQDLKEEYEDRFEIISKDRSICPEMGWVQHLYADTFKKAVKEEKKNMVQSLKLTVEMLQSKGIESKYELVDGDYVIAAVSPLMTRAHTFMDTMHVVYLNSFGKTGRYESRIYILMADSKIGELPLGLFVTSKESKELLTTGFSILQKIWGGNAFHFHPKGPTYFVTDDNPCQIRSLKSAYPESGVLISSYHMMHAVWKWLCDKANEVDSNDRQELYLLFKRVLISTSDVGVDEALEQLFSSLVANKYPKYIKLMQRFIRRSKMWSLNFRCDPLFPIHINMFESTMNVMNNKFLAKTRMYNLYQLMQYSSEAFSEHIKNNILSEISGKRNATQQNDSSNTKSFDGLQVVERRDETYTVENFYKGELYSVNMALGFCDCLVGNMFIPCKHQNFIVNKFKLNNKNPVIFNDQEISTYYFIATGNNNILVEEHRSEINWDEQIQSNWVQQIEIVPSDKDREQIKEELPYEDILIGPETEVVIDDSCLEFDNNEEIYEEESIGSLESADESEYSCDDSYKEPTPSPESRNDYVSWETTGSELDEMSTYMTSYLRSRFVCNPEGVSRAIKKMFSKMMNLETESEFLAAMNNFGTTNPTNDNQVELLGRGAKRKYTIVSNYFKRPKNSD